MHQLSSEGDLYEPDIFYCCRSDDGTSGSRAMRGANARDEGKLRECDNVNPFVSRGFVRRGDSRRLRIIIASAILPTAKDHSLRIR